MCVYKSTVLFGVIFCLFLCLHMRCTQRRLYQSCNLEAMRINRLYFLNKVLLLVIKIVWRSKATISSPLLVTVGGYMYFFPFSPSSNMKHKFDAKKHAKRWVCCTASSILPLSHRKQLPGFMVSAETLRALLLPFLELQSLPQYQF